MTARSFRNVRKLPPGHLLRWRDGRAELSKYWKCEAAERFEGNEEEAATALRGILADAVRSHMVSDVPLGAFLSGGVDSSVVVGLMAEASSAPVQTFSIGFDEPQFDELEHARAVAKHFGTEHHEFVVRPDGLSILDRLIEHFDEPFADSSAIPTWYVSEIARRHVTVVLSGDGGDELFGGYDRYLPHPRVAQFDRMSIPGARQLAGAVWPLLPHGFARKEFSAPRRARRQRAISRLCCLLPARTKRSRCTRRGCAGRSARGVRRRASARDSTGSTRSRTISRMMRFDFETYLPDDVLTKVDRMSMAHSIESRVPLLDNRVIDFAATLPAHFKIPEWPPQAHPEGVGCDHCCRPAS